MILSCNEMCHRLCWLASLFFEKHLSYSKSLTWQATAANVRTRSWSKCTAICCPVGNCQWLLWSHSTNVWWLVVAKFCRQKVFSWAFCWYHISCGMGPRVGPALPVRQPVYSWQHRLLHSSSAWRVWQVPGINGMSSSWRLWKKKRECSGVAFHLHGPSVLGGPPYFFPLCIFSKYIAI